MASHILQVNCSGDYFNVIERKLTSLGHDIAIDGD